jgi:hypothetical protein
MTKQERKAARRNDKPLLLIEMTKGQEYPAFFA